VFKKVKETLALGNKAAQKCAVERLNLRLLNELEVIVGIMLLYWAEAYIL
jgi:hypothetical protein